MKHKTVTNIKLIIFLILFGISSTSCLKIYLRIYGIKTNKLVNERMLSSFLIKNAISDSLILELDSNKYAALIDLKTKDTLNYKHAKWWTQNHIQPIQVIYFDLYANKSIAAFFNCVAETRGISTMTWNKENELDFFPPRTYDKWSDSLFTSKEILNTVIDLKAKKEFTLKNNKKYLVLLFYTLFIEKQSLNMIREVNYNLSKYGKDDYQLYYINMDNYFYSLLKK